MLARIIHDQSAFSLTEVLIALLALIMVIGLVLPALSGMMR